MGLVTGFVEPVMWASLLVHSTDDEVEAYIDQFIQGIHWAQANDTQFVALVLFHRSTGPNSVQRKRMAEGIREYNDDLAKRLIGVSYAFDSAVLRGAVTAISWIVREPFKEKVFSRPRDAAKHLRLWLPSIDPGSVLAEVKASLPDEHRDAIWGQPGKEAAGG